MERINEETGELSTSGESTENTELKNAQCHIEPGGEENSYTGLDATMALKKQLLELEKATVEQREEQLLHLLPTFIQVCESSRCTEDLDLQSLATHIAETLVFHIQQRVAGRPAEEARFELEQFFHQTEHGRCKGWLLLKATSFLSINDAGVKAAIITGLAAALVKCLYLFVALPAKKVGEQNDEECSFQEILIQVILQLCRQVQFVEQLVETEELRCVIIALTSLWDQCSSSWRRQASLVLRAVSAAQVPNIVPTLQAKNCIKICIQNLLKMSKHVDGMILAEVAVSVFSFVKDSYSNNPVLFEEFENNDGYTVLQSIMARCEEETSEEDFSPVQDLLDLIASFTLFGKAELKVALCVNNPQPPGFKFDPPLSTGTAVKNLRAFQILQSSFLRSGSALICSQILRTMHKIWAWDKANFFLLEWTLQCLAQLADSTWQKPATVHSFFFKLLETVVFQLSYIPHDTLQKVQAVLKVGSSQAFSMAALKCFHDMVINSSLLSDVLSDGGLMELLLVELRRRAKILRKAGILANKGELRMEDCERQLTTNMLSVVAALAMRSIKNTVFIRDSGMIPYIKIFLDDEMYRSPTLCILEQLSETNPEEYMSTAIGALCSSTETELQLKQDLLHSILKVLDNPNSWNAFRTAGGFTSLLSMLVDMEGSLLQQPVGVWASLNHQSLMELLLLTLHTMAMAVHLHPVNAHFFHITNLFERLAEALLLIGCFLGCAPVDLDTTKDHRTFQDFLKLTQSSGCSLTAPLQDCVRVLDFLEQFATGISMSTDLCAELKEPAEIEENQLEDTSQKTGADDFQGRIRKAALSLSSVTQESGRFSHDPSILHPGAIKVIMTLVPHIYCPNNPQLSVELQLAVVHHVQSLVKSERNRQIMCESGLLETLLSHCRGILSNSTHSLHLPVVRILEKLASQSIEHKSLRQFLCLQPPLTRSSKKCISSPVSEDDLPHKNPPSNGHCANQVNEDCPDSEKRGSKNGKQTPKRSFSLLNAPTSMTPVPLHQIITLVSITSPRSFRPHKVSVSPSFVEFDMTDSGYGCLFLPSLATVKGVSADSIATGGIGGDCRGFPPSAGLSFSCWFLISRFSSACDSHPVRLLTVVRHMSRAEQHFSCLSVSISSSGCLVISTEEEAYQSLDMMEPMPGTPTSLPTTVRFNCSKQLMPGLWHHVVVTMAKDIKKSCKVTGYLNGELLGTSTMRYIQPFPGPCIAMDASAVIDVCGIIGTPPIWKQHAALIWRVGPTYLFEEVLSSSYVEIMYAQGTRYLGSYLALDAQADGKLEFSPVRLVLPERISFGINPAVATVTTVAEIRDQYNEVDSRLIAKEMGIQSRDNSTPVFLARNISQHLSGTARTLGAALVGHFGVRTFTSNTASISFQNIGGPAVVLSLVAMATDDSSLYAAVKVLLSVLDTNPVMKQEMKRIGGYKVFAFILKMKAHLISCRTFQLILAIVGTVELGTGSVYVHDLTAFQGILCNFEVWQKAPENLDLSVLSNFVDILKSSSGDPRNAEAIHSLNLMTKLLFLLEDPIVTNRKVTVICTIITCLLQNHFNPKDIHRLGLFLIHTLLPPSVNEKTAYPCVIFEDQSQALSQTPGRTIWIRNRLLEVLSLLIISDTPLPNNKQEEVFFMLGSDWFLQFLQGHIHSSTVLLVLKMLVHFLSHQNIRAKFKETVSSGTLMENMPMLLGIIDNLRMRSWSYGCLSGTFPGFTVLPRLLLHHISLPQIYGVFAALLFGKSGFHVPDEQGDLDSMLQSVIDNSANEQGVQLCTEAACVLIELVKMIICKPITGSEDSWDVQYPGSVMQFLCLVHSNFPRDALWGSTDFLNSLASAVFPTEISENAAGPQSNEDIVDTSSPRMSHPARKQVCDFIRILLMDSLINIPAKDQQHPFIQLLEFSPDNVCQEQKQSFQSELLEFLMDIIHITGQEGGQSTHLARDDSSKSSSERKFTVLSENVAFFSKMLVVKLYNGMFVADPENLLVFIVEQIAMALERRQPQREDTVSILYKSLNRAVLYFLSRPRQTPAEKELILRTLHVLQQHWDIIMATYNASVHFISCLLHCFLLIRSGSFPEGFGCEMHKKTSRKIWRHLFPHKNNQIMAPVDIPNSAEVESELLKVVESTWDIVMQERRHSLEEAYKIDLSAKQAGKETLVSMSDVSPLWEELAMKSWQVFIDSQKKKLNIGQRKISILSSRSPQRTPGKDPEANVETFLADLEVHRKIGEEMFETLLKNHMQALRCENELMAVQWLRIEEDLLRERGLFGPGPGVFTNQGWVQDAAEGPNRTRLRIRRKAARRSKKLPSLMPGLYMKHSPVDESKGVAELGIADAELRILCESGREAEQEPGLDCEHLTFFPTLTEVSSPTEDISDECVESQLIIQQLAPNEEIKEKHCITVVSGHMLLEGVLLFGKADLYVCEGFTLTSNGDVRCGNHQPTSVRDSFIIGMLKKERSSVNPVCRRWSYEDIKEAHFMRFLLEENAIEIFMKNGASVFLVFVNKDHFIVFKRLCSIVPSLKGRGVTESMHNVRKTAALEKAVIAKWQKGEMSNFEYLMHLNTLAGRTYNDLMQYPVFPWILADYESETLDLSSPTSFRDLSKPMGAQNEKRREKFIQRYNEVDSNEGELSAQCHYCTHYSSAIIVASYLVRMEPFSQTFLSLQGGSFDVPERMFHSIRKEWESASKDNMSDVRELIPEFFYLPDFLINSNNFEFGCMQDGTFLGDVVLPPWAKGDPQEFIRMHREALESDYVSANLHLWIDLIFGCKQQGPAAVEALNTFHPYFYTDKHDAESMKNPLKKSTVLGYISNFGQIPKQIFTKPHPSRIVHKSSASKDTTGASHITPFFLKLDKLKPSVQPLKELMCGHVGQIICGEKDVLVVEKNKLLMPPFWNTYFCWGYYDSTCSFGSYTTEKDFAVWEGLSDWGEAVCAACPNNNIIITAGSSTVVCVWDLSISKDKLKYMKLKQALYGHTGTVTCVVVSESHSVIISGSQDQTCILWDLEELNYITQLPAHSSGVTALAINELTGEIVSCSGTNLYLWTMKGQLLASVNTPYGPEGSILCCCFTQKNEWDPRNVIITGCADGIVRIWKTEYTKVQLPGHEEHSVSRGDAVSLSEEDTERTRKRWERHLVLCRELNRSQIISRRRYKNNPAVTALAISRTHGTLLVGDAWGRVFSWTYED